MENNSRKPIITAIKAIIVHTFGVQVQANYLGSRYSPTIWLRFQAYRLNTDNLAWPNVYLKSTRRLDLGL